MADFCNQCAAEINGVSRPFGEGDLADLISKEESRAGNAAVAICEGCGITAVDYLGNCVDVGCLKQHGVSRAWPLKSVTDKENKMEYHPEEEALVADGYRFRRIIKLMADAFKYETLDDLGPHPAMARLKELAEPIFEAMDSDDPTITLEGVPNIVRNLLDQVYNEGLL